MSTTNQNKTWVLIGNYPPDHQESMLRFTRMLATGLQQQGLPVKIIQPCVLLGFFARTTQTGFGKWLAYIDKWLLFPILLLAMRLLRSGTWYHICDHSNAPYIFYLPKKRTSLTCHDVLAIQAAYGDASTHCTTGRMGKLLQRYILSGLKACRNIATVSAYTLENLQLLEGKRPAGYRRRVIMNALNDAFCLLPDEPFISKQLPATLQKPYLLHVGSSLERKNRKALLYMAAALGNRWNGDIVFAGAAMEPALVQLATNLGLQGRIHNIIKPAHHQLNLLYNRCAAFVFPSYSEGFGWPLIEAQTCGAPVIANNIPVLQEVCGAAALHVAADDARAMAAAFLQLNDPQFRKQLVQQGLENASRFSLAQMTRAYLEMQQTALPLPHSKPLPHVA